MVMLVIERGLSTMRKPLLSFVNHASCLLTLKTDVNTHLQKFKGIWS